MKKKTIVLAALAAVLTLEAAAGSAWAYFTTYTEARGGYPIELEDTTTIREEFSAWTKHVVVASEKDSRPVYVRVKALNGSEYTLTYTDTCGKWTPGSDGYYYYSDIVNGGEATGGLDIKIGNVPESVEDGSSFNIVVVYETTPVRYDENGKPYADWNATLDIKSGQWKGGA